MASSDLSRSRSMFSEDGAAVARSPAALESGFQSILLERLDRRASTVPQQPEYFVDLNLDQVLESLTRGREHYDLKPFFYEPLHDAATVRYRHEVLRDLEKAEVLALIRRFAGTMARMRGLLEQIDQLHYRLEKQAWFVDAIEIYCEAAHSLARDLSEHELTSRGLCALRDYLADYVASERFTSLQAETQALKRALSEIRYAIRIQGAKVTVIKYEGDPDYSKQVQETFARFRQGAVGSYLVALPDSADINHVEARMLEGVAELYPDVFETRAKYCARHRNSVDPAIVRFDREVQFYVAYLELVERVRKAGLPFCYPRVSARDKEVAATETFDIALANKLVSDDRAVVRNDFYLDGPERMFVVSGPNNGGKTTFARTFAQLHHLAGLGLLVPGTEARLFLPDHIFTHFEQQEDIETLRGKFDDELVRVHKIVQRATSGSVIVLNESFNSTTLNDALFVGTEVVRRILELGALGVYVTFLDEIASLGDATVSMVTQILPDDPAERTFKILRQPADGLAYAWAIAEKYGLTYQRVMERISA